MKAPSQAPPLAPAYRLGNPATEEPHAQAPHTGTTDKALAKTALLLACGCLLACLAFLLVDSSKKATQIRAPHYSQQHRLAQRTFPLLRFNSPLFLFFPLLQFPSLLFFFSVPFPQPASFLFNSHFQFVVPRVDFSWYVLRRWVVPHPTSAAPASAPFLCPFSLLGIVIVGFLVLEAIDSRSFPR
ncbi:uncharacterized protein SPSK_10425 [Sporothrix schenckii 1099-18]|uniref:Uncharacterized protein n=1 Tax=Sporothrix schenckii 1099-18 TaxID=1397361 RepID=A0A0F2MCA8_SPOSC|nr:uncharacterized protein SPSK_10425 [Sporothrix schenckii 1099-18]KJR87343.1 hypothetical protein SPSK_10425 [Sporothrix schenckii 1099-18]